MNWIKSKPFDLIFFIPVWFPLLFLVVAGFSNEGSAAAAVPLTVFLIYHALIRLPHFLITFPVIYLRDWRLLNGLMYFVIPILILVIYFIFPHSKPLICLAVIWGWFHIGMQNYGFQRLYLKINDSKLAVSNSYLCIYLGFIFSKILQAVHYFAFGNQSPELFKPVLYALNSGLFAAGFYLLFLKFAKFKERINTADYFLILAVLMLLDWPGITGMSQLSYFYLFNLHHCLAYLGISSLLEGNDKPVRWKFKTLYPALALISSVLVALLVIFDSNFLGKHVADDSGFHPLFLGLFVVHYYLDGLAWKVRKNGLSLNRSILLRKTHGLSGEKPCLSR